MHNAKPLVLHEGTGRAKISLSAQAVGDDLIVRLFNGNEHVGAVALSEYHPVEKRASTSVISRFGHRDDSVAYAAAYRICRRLRKPVCAVVGIHLDAITEEEIRQITANCDTLIGRYIEASAGKP
jgi:hypothetical protein